MATTLRIVAGNTAPPFLITCERAGTVINLTSVSSVVLKIKGTVITQPAGSCTITSASAGIISYIPVATDFPTAGSYKADVKITYNDASFEILYDQLRVKARAPIS